MGVESAVYRFLPASESFANSSVDTLIKIGAKVDRTDELVLRGPGYWIDIQLNMPTPSVGLRVAFSNPPEVTNKLREAIVALGSDSGGHVVDLSTGERGSAIDAEYQDRLLADFRRRQEAFQRDFGPFVAAVSARDVFRLIREGVNGARDGG